MGAVEDLRKLVGGKAASKAKTETKGKEKEKQEAKKAAKAGTADIVGQMIEKFKKKQQREGYEEEIEISAPTRIKAGAEELAKSEQVFVRLLSKIYLSVGPLKFLTDRFMESESGKEYDSTLVAAGIEYSAQQYLALIFSYTFISAMLTFPYLMFLAIMLDFPLFIPFVGSFVAASAALIIGLAYPKSKAGARGNKMEKELPYALRHLATQIKAGIDLHASLISVADGGYGLLSDEFGIVLDEIDKGTPTPDALAQMRSRTQSRGLRRSLTQFIRALRTGGDLSHIISVIAADIAYELRMKMKDYGEKLNLVGVLFMFICVVFPIMFGILSSIYPLLGSPLPQEMIYGFYFLMAPMLSFLVMFMIHAMDPAA